METMKNAFSSWSGGKDSCLALYFAEKNGYDVTVLLNMLTADGAYSRSHGLKSRMLEIQAEAMGKKILFGRADWANYENVFFEQLLLLNAKGVKTGVFGDIDLQEHRDWVERVCGKAHMAAVLPLWQNRREQLLEDFFSSDFRAVIVCVKEAVLSREWLGRELDRQAADDFQKMGIDICGEEGEYHSFVFDGPLFNETVRFTPGPIRSVEGYSFLELRP